MKGHPMFITQFVGSSVVVVLLATIVVQQPNLEQYLLGLVSFGLKESQALQLHEGQSAWCPLGWVPLLVGVRPDVEWKKTDVKLPSKKTKDGAIQRYTFCVGCTVAYDKRSRSMISDDVALNLSAIWIKANKSLPMSVRENSGVLTWMESMKVPTTTKD